MKSFLSSGSSTLVPLANYHQRCPQIKGWIPKRLPKRRKNGGCNAIFLSSFISIHKMFHLFILKKRVSSRHHFIVALLCTPNMALCLDNMTETLLAAFEVGVLQMNASSLTLSKGLWKNTVDFMNFFLIY